jgi:hypothetical protein
MPGFVVVVEMGAPLVFCLSWPWIVIFLISTSQVVRTTEVSDYAQLAWMFSNLVFNLQVEEGFHLFCY